jgi:hypothetical protein
MIGHTVTLVCVVAAIIGGNAAFGQSPLTEAQDEVKQAEIRKLNAERTKLELEAKELERRLSERWWESWTLFQTAVATIITAGVLFAWWRGFLEPILRRESRLNELDRQVLAAENKKLSTERGQIEAQKSVLEAHRDQLKDDGERLTKERDALKARQELLKQVVSGLNTAVIEAAGDPHKKFFSIMNSGDPIYQLRSCGWQMWSTNYFGRLGYYLVMKHPRVSDGKEIYVGRVTELHAIKRELPDSWHEYVAKVNEKAPLVVLDYTYFALLADAQAVVGGEVYRKGGEGFEFYAPLKDWAEKLEKRLLQL